MIGAIGSQLSGMDTSMTMSRMRPQGPPPDPAEFAAKIMEDQDADGDGALTIQELSGTPLGDDEELFAEVDADGDGLLTQSELETHMTERQAEMKSQMEAKGMAPPSSEEDMTSTLLQALNQAQSAYEDSNWLSDLLGNYQSSVLSGLDLTA